MWLCEIFKNQLVYERLNFISKSSRPEVFCKKGVLWNFAKLTGNHLCFGSATLLKKRLVQAFSCEFYEILKNTFFHKISPVAASERLILIDGKLQKKSIIFDVNTLRTFLMRAWMANKHLTFLLNVLFSRKHIFGVFPIGKFYNDPFSGAAFLLNGSLWQPSISKGFTLILEFLHNLSGFNL